MSSAFDQGSLGQCLERAAGEVLETMFFSSIEVEQKESAPVGDRIGTSLVFHGAQAGRLELSLEREAAAGLAASFFGDQPGEEPDEECRSVMGELTNMVCGAMLSHLNRKAIFCLDPPVAIEPGREAEGEVVRHLRLEEGLLRLAFTLEGKEA